MTPDPLRARLTDWVVGNLAVPDVLTFDAEDVADRLAVMVREEVERANGAEVVHECPLDRGATTPCCGKSPFELHPQSRMTVMPELITCPKREVAALTTERDRLRSALAAVLGQFQQAKSRDGMTHAPYYKAALDFPQMDAAREALGDGS